MEIEIGFGMGEALIQNAMDNPDRHYVGIEENWERIYRTLKRMASLRCGKQEANVLNNVRVLKVDARVAFGRLLAAKSVERVYCLFPCPWPKKDHVKHRLFSTEFIRKINSALKDNGELQVVTDFYPYYEWVLEQAKDTGFDPVFRIVKAQFNTKFEKKWQKEGQDEFFEILLKKSRHINLDKVKDVDVKTYSLENFNAQRFQFQDKKDKECSVVFKEMLYDEKREKALILLVVSEEYLTQTFWVAVVKKEKKWNVSKANGQKFYPTPGIEEAVRLVYESALNK